MKVIIAGDYSPRYNLKGIIREGKHNELFSEIMPLTAEADFSIVNFETTIEGYGAPIPKCGPALSSPKESVEVLKNANFNIATLANNHSLDYGEDGLSAILDSLKKANIATVGVGSNLEKAQEPLYLEKSGKRLAIINCCEHEFSIAGQNKAGANPINSVSIYYQIKQARNNADYVLVITHGGHEYFQLPSPRMQESFRFFIDVGADIVVNHHQHCYSGYEIYNGKPIFYGLGNFLFDQPQLHPESGLWWEGFLLMLDFSNQGITFKLYPYRQCAEKYGVTLISDRAAFDKKINELNSIIQDKDKLRQSVDEFYASKQKEILSYFSPIESRIYRYAIRHNWVPSFLRKRKMRFYLNLVDCEAHHDMLSHILKNYSLK